MEQGNNNQEEKKDVLTFDEILKDPEYQSAHDKKVAEALKTAKAKWEEEAKAKQSEAEKLAKMDAEEKNKYEIKKETERANKAESELNAYKLKDEAVKIAKEKGVNVSLLEMLDFTHETADTITSKIEQLEKIYKDAVKEGIQEALKEKTPRYVTSNAGERRPVSRSSF